MNMKLVIGASAVLVLAVFAGPLLLFVPMLSRARRQGLLKYGLVATEYSQAFREKWIDGRAPAGEPFLGSGDIQSLADLGNSYSVGEQMRIVPVTRSGVLQFVGAFLAPIVPLMLTVMSADVVEVVPLAFWTEATRCAVPPLPALRNRNVAVPPEVEPVAVFEVLPAAVPTLPISTGVTARETFRPFETVVPSGFFTPTVTVVCEFCARVVAAGEIVRL